MFSARDTLQQVDPELWQAIEAEDRRQEDHRRRDVLQHPNQR